MHDLIFIRLPESSLKSLANSHTRSKGLSRRFTLLPARLTALLTAGIIVSSVVFLRAQPAVTFQRAQITLANSAHNGLVGPFGVAVDGQGNVYISDWSGRLLKETPSGVGFGGFSQSVILSGITEPNDVAVDTQGNVYIAIPSGEVLKLSPSGGTYTQTVVANTANNGIDQPCGVAVDGSGNVYISDFASANVYKETLSGSAYSQSTVATYTGNGLFEPCGVAVDGVGNVYIADVGHNRVLKETLSGSSYTQSIITSGLDFPYGVAIDAGGNVYIADTENQRVLKETLSSGSYVQSILVSGFDQPESVAIDASGNLYTADNGAAIVYEEKFSQVDFGPTAVGATSSTIAVTFQFNSAVTLNTKTPYQLLTMGALGLDYADAGSTTCAAASYTVGNTCIVNVAFSPKLAGTRNGAVVLFDSSGNAASAAYISGTGQAPQVIFAPGMQNVVANSGNGLVNPWDIAVDGDGDVYISVYGSNSVLKETLSGGSYTQSVVTNNAIGGLSYPRDVALDGSGNVYIADAGNNRVLKETASGASYIQTVVANSGTNGLSEPFGVAVDGSGNVYIVDGGNNRVLKETLAAGSYTQSVVTSGLDNPLALAVDGNENLYITDMLNKRVLKETYSNGSYAQSVLANAANNGLGDPYGVAVDGSGNVYISDTSNTVYKETLTESGYTQSVVANSATDGLSDPQGVAVDGLGNIYIADFNNNRVLQEDLADPPVLNFGTEAYGITSAVQSIQAVNNGNETLSAVPPGISVPPGFLQETGSGTPPDCTATFSLAAGMECNIGIEFSPLSGEFGSLIGNVLLTDNNLNASSKTQAIELLGKGTQGTPAITWATPTAILLGTALSAAQLDATANIPGTFVYTPAAGAVLAAGPQILSVTFMPQDTTDYTSATATVTLVVYPPVQMAEPNEWAWMGGSSTLQLEGAGQNYGEPGIYGTLDVAGANNIPGGRSWSSNWTDSQGNFWLFGGWGYDSAGTLGELNDVWEFNPATEEWTWMGGSGAMAINSGGTNGQPGVYGTLGTPAAANIPGGRDSASSWIDSSGNFWLFGGEGIDSAGNFSNLDDLWEFSPTTNEWTWKGGNSVACTSSDEVTSCGQDGVYGKLGVAAAGNLPGNRLAGSAWTDSQGNLWLFGGTGLDSAGTNGDMNDLWEYDPSTSMWAWMGGSNMGGDPGQYGNLGASSTSYLPSARDSATAWTDKSGNFWLFGGEGIDSDEVSGSLNDLWEYSPSSGQWTWVAGSSTVPAADGGQPGTYGTLGTPASGNTPGGRFGATGIMNSSGNLALFGGSGFDSTDTLGDLNDAWIFKPSVGQWVWKGGSSTVGCQNCGQPGVYGGLGSPAAGDAPGGRVAPSGWIDSGDNTWVFGGSGYDSKGVLGSLNDLWVVGKPAEQPVLSLPTGTYTQTESVTITDTTPGATIYYTTDGSAPTLNSAKYSSAIQVTQTTTITAIADAAGYITSPVAAATYTITPATLSITWPAPAAITYGTGLSATQLDATANVGGGFVYTPAVGTVLAAGNQTLSVTFTPADTAHYKSTTTTVSITVNKAILTVTAASIRKIYGAAPPSVTYSLTGFVNGDSAKSAVSGTPSLSTTATSQSPVGSYPITAATGTLAAENYTFQFVAGTLAVTPASLTVTANNATVRYDMPMPAFAYAFTGFLNGDGPSVLSGAPAETTIAKEGSLPGTYQIAISRGSLKASNYSFVFVNGLLTITPVGQAAKPVFKPKPGIGMSEWTVIIMDRTPGAAIFYTFYGEKPTMRSKLYTGPFKVKSTTTIKAIAVARGYTGSTETTAKYIVE